MRATKLRHAPTGVLVEQSLRMIAEVAVPPERGSLRGQAGAGSRDAGRLEGLPVPGLRHPHRQIGRRGGPHPVPVPPFGPDGEGAERGEEE
jgi:hypothetical protein